MFGAIIEIVLDIIAWCFKHFREPQADKCIKVQAEREAEHVEEATEIATGVDPHRAGVLLSTFPGDKIRKATSPKVK